MSDLIMANLVSCHCRT